MYHALLVIAIEGEVTFEQILTSCLGKFCLICSVRTEQDKLYSLTHVWLLQRYAQLTLQRNQFSEAKAFRHVAKGILGFFIAGMGQQVMISPAPLNIPTLNS